MDIGSLPNCETEGLAALADQKTWPIAKAMQVTIDTTFIADPVPMIYLESIDEMDVKGCLYDDGPMNFLYSDKTTIHTGPPLFACK